MPQPCEVRDVLEAADGGGGQVEVGERTVVVEGVADRAAVRTSQSEYSQSKYSYIASAAMASA